MQVQTWAAGRKRAGKEWGQERQEDERRRGARTKKEQVKVEQDAEQRAFDARAGQVLQMAAMQLHVAVNCAAALCGTPWGFASVPPLRVDAPSGQMRQVAAPAWYSTSQIVGGAGEGGWCTVKWRRNLVQEGHS